jgi:hypothetical protein
MNPEIRFRVPQHVWDLANETAERYGLSEQKGKTGGASQYARGALYTALGLALPDDLHRMQSHSYATVRQARRDSELAGPPRLKVEVHHRIHPDYRKNSVLKGGRPVAARTTTVLEFAQGELPEFLVPYVALTEQGLPRAALNLEGKLSPRRHALGELISAGESCTLDELAACLSKLKSIKAQKARRSQEHETRGQRGEEILRRWTAQHGSELLKGRLAGGFSWSEFAQEEYAAHRLAELGLKSAVSRGTLSAGLGLPAPVRLHPQTEPTLSTMKRIAQLATMAADSGVHANAVFYQDGRGAYFEAVRLRVETPMPGRRTFLLDPIPIPGGPAPHGL